MSQTPQKPRQDLVARAFALAERIFKMYSRLAATSAAHAHIADELFRAVTQETKEFIAMLTVSVRKLRSPIEGAGQ